MNKNTFKPFPAQQEIIEAFERNRFIVVAAGNRFGKTKCCIAIGIRYFMQCINENRHIKNPDLLPSVYWQILAPTRKIAEKNWRELKSLLPKECISRPNDTIRKKIQNVIGNHTSEFIVETIGNGIIHVSSAYDINDKFCLGLDLCTISDAERFKNFSEIWSNVEARLEAPDRGSVQDRQGQHCGRGKAIICCVDPTINSDVWELWRYGQKSISEHIEDWWSCAFPWTDNPINEELAKSIVHTKYGDVTYEETLRRQLGEQIFRRNYLVDW